MNKQNFQLGVSVTELAISIAIIGLLLAGTLGGVNLLKAAKIRALATELTDLKQNIETFKTSYEFYPGDLPIAYTYWSEEENCKENTSGDQDSCNGDGNEKIEAGSSASEPIEDLLAWSHLTFAGLSGGSYSGAISSGSLRNTLNANIAESDSFLGTAIAIIYPSSSIFGVRGNAILIAKLNSSGVAANGALKARDAYYLDSKIDDALASSGLLFGARGASGCTDNNPASSSNGAYALDESGTNCRLIYWIDKSY